MGDSSISVTQSEPQVPLRFLFSSLAIAKKYIFMHLLTVIIQSLKSRLTPETFNLICAAAIRYDVMSLRTYCVEFARKFASEIQDMKSARKLSPEVEVELAGIWEMKDPAPKRRRL